MKLAAVILLIAILVTTVLWASSQPVDAKTPPTCWWDGTTVRAAGLPSRLFGITADGFPHGVWLSSPDGTFSRELPPVRIIFYTRGGGGALFKFGAQYQDYHPICVAVP